MANFSHATSLFPQEEGGNKTAAVFPLTLVFEAAKQAGDGTSAGFGAGLWRPDWPLELPPDAFKAESGELSACTVEWGNFSLRLSFDGEGRLEGFPFMLNGSIAQVTVAYRELSEVNEVTLSFPSGGGECKLEFPEGFAFKNYFDSLPFLARASLGDAWYFINFSGSAFDVLETWYDGEGNVLGTFGFSLAETGNENKIRKYWNYSDPYSITEFHYDSRGFITETVGPDGFFKVGYFREDLPRYWERGPSGTSLRSGEITTDGGVFSFQWDEGNFLVNMRGDAGRFVDSRYEYTLDEMGNWTERREIRMIQDFGLLFPSPGVVFNRVLEYRE